MKILQIKSKNSNNTSKISNTLKINKNRIILIKVNTNKEEKINSIINNLNKNLKNLYSNSSLRRIKSNK